MDKMERRWVAKLEGRWVAKLVAKLLMLRQLSGFESTHLLKIHNGRRKQWSGQHTDDRLKNVQKNVENQTLL
jgi:hypothetical protein